MLTRCARIGALILLTVPLYAVDRQAEIQARKAMDEFMTTFNSGDVHAWANALNYPNVRFASNTVLVYGTAGEFERDNADYPKRLAPWHHSRWGSVNAIQSGPDKVHFSVEVIRYDASGKEISSRFPTLYVVTLKDGHWGVQARSSFAPYEGPSASR
jgi:hypothetical protein